MHATGYLEARPRHPVALGAAIAINLVAVGAMLAYNPQIIGYVPKSMPTIKIAPLPPVKPVERPKTEKVKLVDPQPQRPTTIEPIQKIETVDPTPWPQFPPEPSAGAGTGEGPIQPKPLPVEIPAQIDARFARELQPVYPAALERAEIEGSATVRVQIGTDGRVIAIELVRADDPGFFAATRDQALRRWRFRPATRDGAPIVSWLTQTVRFTIHRN